MDSYLKNAAKKVEKKKKEIEIEHQRLADIDNGHHASLVKERDAKTAEKERLEAEWATSGEDRAAKQDAASQAKKDAENVKVSVTSKEKDIAKLNGEVQNLKANGSNGLVTYGPNVPTLVEQINKRNWRGEKPVGPVGNHIKLLDIKWSGILEKQLANQLNAFLVSNHQDKEDLLKIMDRLNM